MREYEVVAVLEYYFLTSFLSKPKAFWLNRFLHRTNSSRTRCWWLLRLLVWPLFSGLPSVVSDPPCPIPMRGNPEF